MHHPSASRNGPLRRAVTPGPMTAGAVISGWIAIYLVYQQHLVGILFAVLTTALAWQAWRQGRLRTATQQASLRHALEAAGARNRELDRLRRLAASLLSG